MPVEPVDLDSFIAVVSAHRTADQLYLSPGWLAVEHDCADVEPLYVAAQAEGEVAALVCYGFTDQSNPWPFARPDLFVRDVLDIHVPGSPLLPSYCLGGRRPGHSDALVGPADLLQRCVDRATAELAGRGAAALIAPYVDGPVLAEALEESGFAPLASLSRWELAVAGETFSDYLATLPRGTRSNISTERRRIRDAGLIGGVSPLCTASVGPILALELVGYERFGHDYQRREADRLHRAVLDHLADDVFVSRVAAEADGRLLGFAILVRSGNALYVRQGAVDHDQVGRLPVYFEAVFYQTIEFAYANGIEVIDFSISSDQAKRLRGCTEVPTQAYVLLCDPARQEELGRVAKGQQPASKAGR